MKYKGGDIIRNLRKNMGVSQEEMAKRLYISQRTYSRIENGETEPDWMEFVLVFTTLGHFTDDFWIMYLDYEEYMGYMQYQRIRKSLLKNNVTEAQQALTAFMQSSLAKLEFMRQFTTAMPLILTETCDHKLIEGLNKALAISIPAYNPETATHNYTYIEIMIINSLATAHSTQGNHDLAASMLQGVVHGLDNNTLRITRYEKAMGFPKTIVNLYHILFQAQRYQEAQEQCVKALTIGRQLTHIIYHPDALYFQALCKMHTGALQEEYTPLLARAYHGACGVGQTILARRILEAYHEATGK